MKRLSLICLFALWLVACGGVASPTLPPTLAPPQVIIASVTPAANKVITATPRSGTASVAPTPAPPADFAVTAPDGVTLAATFYPPAQAGAAKAPGVLLLPMLGHPRTDWDEFARELQLRGIAALALDLRGQGQSAGPADWPKAPADVSAAWDALAARPEVDPEHTAILGASIGANLALVVGANNASVNTVIALSPGLDYHGLKPASGLGNFGQRPVLLVASQEDAESYTGVQQLATGLPQGETYYFTNAGHGTAMFAMPTLAPLLFSWLEEQLGILKG